MQRFHIIDSLQRTRLAGGKLERALPARMRENEWSVARAAGQLAHRAASRSSRPLGVPGSRSDCDPPPPEGVHPWGNPVAWRVFVPVNFLSLRRDQGGSHLWLLPEGQEASRLVGCGADRCTGPAFSPDGRWIAYGPEERSADGSRLAFLAGNLGAIRVIALEGGQEEVLPTQMGLVGSWSPDGMRMLFPVMNLGGPQPTVELHAAGPGVARHPARARPGQRLGALQRPSLVARRRVDSDRAANTRRRPGPAGLDHAPGRLGLPGAARRPRVHLRRLPVGSVGAIGGLPALPPERGRGPARRAGARLGLSRGAADRLRRLDAGLAAVTRAQGPADAARGRPRC